MKSKEYKELRKDLSILKKDLAYWVASDAISNKNTIYPYKSKHQFNFPEGYDKEEWRKENNNIIDLKCSKIEKEIGELTNIQYNLLQEIMNIIKGNLRIVTS